MFSRRIVLQIGFIYRAILAFVLLSAGTFTLYIGYLLDNLSLIAIGYFIGMAGASILTYTEMRRITEGLGR